MAMAALSELLKCTMASICAVTNKIIKGALEYPPTREIANACFKEALTVAKAMGYDLGEGYLGQVLNYLEKVGGHKDSMYYDIENKTPTEIDFLGAKIVEYARKKGIQTSYYMTTTNLVKAIEDNYLKNSNSNSSFSPGQWYAISLSRWLPLQRLEWLPAPFQWIAFDKVFRQ